MLRCFLLCTEISGHLPVWKHISLLSGHKDDPPPISGKETF